MASAIVVAAAIVARCWREEDTARLRSAVVGTGGIGEEEGGGPRGAFVISLKYRRAV